MDVFYPFAEWRIQWLLGLNCKFAKMFSAFAASAVNLPWTYDTSGRTVVDVTSKSAASPAGAFVTMTGHWSYESFTSLIRSMPWPGFRIVVF